MRGADEMSGSLFSYIDLEARIPARHPLRKIRQVVNAALASLDAAFAALYTDFGRPSIPPERLIRASLIQILFSIRSERQLMEQMQYNLLFRWFVGLDLTQRVWGIHVLQRDIATLLGNPRAVQLIQKIIGEVFCGALLHMPEFSLNFALLHTWLARHANTSTSSN